MYARGAGLSSSPPLFIGKENGTASQRTSVETSRVLVCLRFLSLSICTPHNLSHLHILLRKVFHGRWRSAFRAKLGRSGMRTGRFGSSCSLSAFPSLLISSESWVWLLPPLEILLCCSISSLRRLFVRALDSSEVTCAFVTLLTKHLSDQVPSCPLFQ
ncbi:hypothetical protein GBAR_LOCUS19934 [Geodia barretti]|uniref:Uncharacterized protein n=1 Tax=Geodia barretti TaxID=519541 RepID=A0AA35WVP4_GEOBA|nr:hypothetical protein GBAR_LOCUS19934 [Geodia barretti]